MPEPNELSCPGSQCAWSGMPSVQRVGPHLGAYCRQCGRFITWLPQSRLWLDVYEGQQSRSGVGTLPRLISECWQIAEDHGFHEVTIDGITRRRSTLERTMLCVTELSELAEAVRKGEADNPSDHITNFTYREEEWADLVIRAFSHAVEDGVAVERLAEAVIAKMAFNHSRPRKHGKVL